MSQEPAVRTITILATRKAKKSVKRVFTLKLRQEEGQVYLDAVTLTKGKYAGERLYSFINGLHGHHHIPLDTMPSGHYYLEQEVEAWLWFGPGGQRWHSLKIVYRKQYGRSRRNNHPTKFQLS